MGKIHLVLLRKDGARYTNSDQEVEADFIPRPGEAIYLRGLIEIPLGHIDTYIVMDVRWVFKGKKMIPEVTAREAHHPSDRISVMRENGWPFEDAVP